MNQIPCLVHQTDNSSKYCTYLLHYDRLPSVRTKDFPKTIVPTFAKVVNILTTAIFATVTILTYFNIKFLIIIIINVINPQLKNIVYRPVLYAQTIWFHIFVPTLVWAVPPQAGGTAEKWGGHSKKNFSGALRPNSCPPLSIYFRRLRPLVMAESNCCTGQPWTYELSYGADTMFHRTYSCSFSFIF